MSRCTQALIYKDNLEYNIKQIKNSVGKNVKVCLAVKADAYGHGSSYFYIATTPATGDFKNWTVYGESAHNINSLSPRHGSVVAVSLAEYFRLVNAYGI